MTTDTDSEEQREDESSNGVLLNRRGYLRMGAAAAAAVFGATATGTAAAAGTSLHGVSFDEVLDAVDDLGLDPNGNRPIDDDLEAASRNHPRALLTFPEGDYLVTRHLHLEGTNFGMVGSPRATVTVPQGYGPETPGDGLLFTFDCERLVFKHFDIDHTPENTIAGCRSWATESFHIEDIEYLGRGTNTQKFTRGNAFQFTRLREGRTGVVKNVRALEGSAWKSYRDGGGRMGFYVGDGNNGTIRFVDCHLEEFGNNGIYASGSGGPIQVEGGIYRNNNVAQVRLGGEGSYVRNATIEVDPEKYTGPDKDPSSDGGNMRGIVWEDSRNESNRAGGGHIKNCDVTLKTASDSELGSQAAIKIWPNGSGVTIRDSRIYVDDDTPGVNADVPGNLATNEISREPRDVTLDNVSITGPAANTSAVTVEGRDGSTVRNSCFHLTGSGTDGVTIKDASNCSIESTNINVAGTATIFDNSSVSTSGLTYGDSCPLPSTDGGSTDGSSSDSTGDATDTSVTTSLPNNVTFDGAGTSSVTDFTFTVAGEVTQVDNPGEDTVDGRTVTGTVYQSTDSFDYEGAIVDITVDGPAAVRRDGERIDPATLGIDDGSTSSRAHTINIASAGGGVATYEFSVDGTLETGAGTDASELVDGTTAASRVGPNKGIDAFYYDGAITDFTLDGAARVYVDGEEVDPANVVSAPTSDGTSDGSGTDSTSLSNSLILDGAGTSSVTDFTFTVDGEVTQVENPGEDTIDGRTVTGTVYQSTDEFAYSGSIVDITVDGPAAVIHNGEEVDPATLVTSDVETTLPNLVVFDGSWNASTCTYAFDVSGEIQAASDVAALESDDTISSGSVAGSVTDDADAYRFSGDVSNLALSGSAKIEFEDTDG